MKRVLIPEIPFKNDVRRFILNGWGPSVAVSDPLGLQSPFPGSSLLGDLAGLEAITSWSLVRHLINNWVGPGEGSRGTAARKANDK